MPTPFVTWLVAGMSLLAPPELAERERYMPPDWQQRWAETSDERRARYEAIAADVEVVAKAMPVLGGPRATAALLVATAFYESAFARDVDQGPCWRGKPGSALWSRCDGGRSACILQIHVGEGSTLEGWTQADLFADRRACLRVGIRLLRSSYVECSHSEPEHRFVAWNYGTCEGNPAAMRESRAIVLNARRLLAVP